MTSIVSISRIKATAETGVFNVMGVFQDGLGNEFAMATCVRPDDPYGLNPLIRDWMNEHEGAYVIEPADPEIDQTYLPYRIAKTTLWYRMTDSEASTMDAIMSEAPAKLKQIYMAATYLSSDDPLWSILHQMLADALSVSRADELLAPDS